MKHLSFELTMPNVGSWNGKWTGDKYKYYIIMSVKDQRFKNEIENLLNGKDRWYYDFGDGWGANVRMEKIDSKEATQRRKLSKGFAGYDWMVTSILSNGKIIS